MENIIINNLIGCIPYAVDVIFAVIGLLVYKKLIPYIKSKYSQNEIKNFQEQLNVVIQWAKIFVDSAQRLDSTGKLTEVFNMTKKEYVMDKLIAQIKNLNYDFTEDQLDEIRRSTVLILEQSEKLIDNTANELTGETNGQTQINQSKRMAVV